MRGKMIKWIGAVGLICCFFAIIIAHPLPDGPGMVTGAPKAYELLRENPDAKEVSIPTPIIDAVLADVHRQRQFFISSLKTAVFFNAVCRVLCFLLYRWGKHIEQSMPASAAGGP